MVDQPARDAARLDRDAARLDRDAARLDDAAVERRLARLDQLLGQLEQIPGRTAELAQDAVAALVEVYGEALARTVDHAAASAEVLGALTGDELLRHLLLLHRVHPDPVEKRAARAIDDIRPQLRKHGTEVAAVEVMDGVARVTISAAGCGSRGAAELVRAQLLAAAPELTGVETVALTRTPQLIPISALSRRPASPTAASAAGHRRAPSAAARGPANGPARAPGESP
jgi:Fe-S cluster biogenesis protein NfuA